MNYDFIEISQSQDKDKPCLDYLEWQYSSRNGWEMYHIEGSRNMEIFISQDQLRIKGSLPYFTSGQNFYSGINDFRNGIDFLCDSLKLDLKMAEVNCLEYGTILEIPFKPKEIFLSHTGIQGMKKRTFDNGIYFEDKVLKHKLYNAGINIKQKLSKQERMNLMPLGYDPKANYLRIENHYKKPSIAFKKRDIQVRDILEDSFQALCREDLFNKYQSIMKTRQVRIQDKKNLSSATIPLLILKEYAEFLPERPEDLIRERIKAIPEEVLSKNDKKSRLRQVRQNFKKIESKESSPYDLSEILKNKAIESQKENIHKPIPSFRECY